MSKKFVLILAGAVVAMGALIAIPNLITEPQSDLSLEYSRQHLTRVNQDLAVRSAELLRISADGSATYMQTGGQERRITISDEEFQRIRALILETGFMQIPVTNYPQSPDATEFTKYTLLVRTGDSQKTFNWVEPDVSEGPVPPIITNIGTHLDSIIDRS